jgi:glycine C-acetyltransferase
LFIIHHSSFVILEKGEGAMFESMKNHLAKQLGEIREAGLYKQERVITTPQRARIRVEAGQAVAPGEVLNMCANNYLGLANHPALVEAAQKALAEWGYGLASVRFICGTQQIHKRLEARISEFLGTDDTILYTSCFDANGGLFETLLSEEDCIISDALNHASIIDGIRLCKAKRLRYANGDMSDLEKQLQDARDSRFRMIATDGVFSMDGSIANLNAICDLAEKYDALVMVDDSHAVGVLGKSGRGTHEHCGVMGRVDVLTGTLGKALGGASGGYTSGRKEIIEYLRQRSRPYLFSNTLAPSITAASIRGLDLLMESGDLREKLWANTRRFREGMAANGFAIKPGSHPIVPIMLGDAVLAQKMAARMLEKGIYVIGFFFPVVPKGQARIRVQCSAAHSTEDILFAVEAFREVKKEFDV